MHAVHGQRYEPPILKTKAEQRDEVEDAEAAEYRRESFFSFADRSAAVVEERLDEQWESVP